MRRSTSLVLAAAAAIAISSPSSFAAPADSQRVIVVSGDGEVTAKPDQARVTTGVVSQAATATAALNANTAAMTRVFAALKTAGIPDNKIQTSNFSVQPQYPPYRADNPQPRTVTGYQVTNQVSVVIDDLTKVGPILDALVKSGANESYGLSFTIANPKPFAEKARAAAVSDAMEKAKGLAEAAGVKLGPILSIQGGAAAIPIPRFAAATMALAAPAPPPIAEGEETVRANVTVTYAIQ